MRLLNRIIEWILFNNIFLAACAVGMCMATEKLVIGRVPPYFTYLHLLLLGSTLLVYNTHALLRKSTVAVSDMYQWTQRNRYWHFIFIGIGAVACLLSVFHLSAGILYVCALLGAASFGYSLPLLPLKEKKRLKDFGWLKIFLLAGVWTVVTSVLPIMYWQDVITDYPIEILIRFVFLFTLCIAFDIRDMQTDLVANIYTLPNRIGLKNSYKLMSVTIALFAFLSMAQYLRYPYISRLIGELFCTVIMYRVIIYTKQFPSDKAYYGLVDGLMMVYAVFLLAR